MVQASVLGGKPVDPISKLGFWTAWADGTHVAVVEVVSVPAVVVVVVVETDVVSSVVVLEMDMVDVTVCVTVIAGLVCWWVTKISNQVRSRLQGVAYHSIIRYGRGLGRDYSSCWGWPIGEQARTSGADT
jgi:hypothetical protein